MQSIFCQVFVSKCLTLTKNVSVFIVLNLNFIYLITLNNFETTQRQKPNKKSKQELNQKGLTNKR